MSMDFYDIELMARERHRDLLRQAEQHRLVKQALASRPRKQNAIVAWLRQAFHRPAPQAQVPCVQVSC